MQSVSHAKLFSLRWIGADDRAPVNKPYDIGIGRLMRFAFNEVIPPPRSFQKALYAVRADVSGSVARINLWYVHEQSYS